MLLTLTGRLTLTTNGTANNTQASSHLELHGTAVGQISKDRYIINDIFNCMQNVGTSGVPFETTQTIVLNVIGQGKTPNFTIKSLARLTVNAKGEVAASLNDFSFICK
ncbi:MAG TPA: hypothetical protein DEB40_14190 [Elusimicrobia bacterium]|nr:hypothetical protein [Elusimicrobiota bacterium]HBT62882.1 hypothetical protein [Elusimicrobiota bacterium]